MQSLLPDRRVIQLSGPDTDALLQGIITQDIGLLKTQPLIFSAMLSPQGKFQHDFFITAHGDDRFMDIDAAHADALMKKLKMYKLRSKVTIEEVSERFKVAVAWDAVSSDNWHQDPRLSELGFRRIVAAEEAADIPEHETDYHTHRLKLGVPEGVVDATDRHFLLELGYDQLQAVSFTKGCFVGQEPTARMHYRHVLRKCLFMVRAERNLPDAQTPILAGDTTLGDMRSSQGKIGLGFARIEPVENAIADGVPITADGVSIQLQLPAYMEQKIEEIKAYAAE